MIHATKKQPPKHCLCIACTRPAELLDVLEALQVDAQRQRNHISLLTAEVERHKAEQLRLANQLDRERNSHRMAKEAWIAHEADYANRGAGGENTSENTGKTAWLGLLVCAACVVVGAVWAKWMLGHWWR